MITQKKIDEILSLVKKMTIVDQLSLNDEDLMEFEQKLPEVLCETVTMLTIPDVARLLCVTKQCIYNWIKAKKMIAINITPFSDKPTLRIKKSDLQTILTDTQATSAISESNK